MDNKGNCRANHYGIDITPIGKEIKKARIEKHITRERLAETVEYSDRQIQSIENKGKFPSVPLLLYLCKIFHVSLDHFIFDKELVSKSSIRRQLDSVLDTLDDKDLLVIKATAESLCKAKETAED